MSRWLTRVALFLLGSSFLAVVGLAALLARGPIDLGYFRPTLEASLSPPDGAFRVELRTVALAWNADENQPEIRGSELRILGREGRTIVEVPTVDVQLQRGALLLGRMVPTDVALRDARLTIVRSADGSLDLGGAGGAPAQAAQVDLREIVDALARRTATEGPLRLSVRGAQIAVADERTGETRRLSDVDLVLEPDATGVDARLAGLLEAAEHRVPVRVAARYRVGSDLGTITLGVRRLPPELLGNLLLWSRDEGPPAWATVLQAPLDGAVAVTLDSALRPLVVRGRVRGAAGTVHVPGHDTSVDVTGLRVRGRVDVAQRTVDLQHAMVGVGTCRLRAAGRLAWTADGGFVAEATTGTEQLPLELLDRWWPPAAAPRVRRWVVDNRRGGSFTDAELELRLGIEGGSRRAALHLRRGGARFAGVGMVYDERLPPLTDASGSVWLDERGWTLRAERGRLGGLELAGATAIFPIGDARGARPRLTAALRGPLHEALAIIDREPFGYASAFGITPDAMKGTMTARLTIEPPPAGSRSAVALSGDAHLSRVATDAVLGGAPVRDGDVELRFAPGLLRANGTARVVSTALAFAWSQEENAARAQTRKATVSGRVDAETRRVLGFDLLPWIAGPLDAEAHLDTANGDGTVDVIARLDDARIDAGIARLDKPAGTPGRAEARLTLRNNVVTAAERLLLEAGPTTVTGTAERRNGWDDVRLTAEIAPGEPGQQRAACAVALDRQRGGYGFRLTSDDAGALLDAIGGQGLRAGSLVLAGTASDGDVSASLDVRNPIFTERSVLKRIVALGSLSSLESAFTGAGLQFERIGAALRWHHPTLTVTDGVAHGPALTLVADGTVDQPSATLDMRGTLIPSYYGLNTAPGRIPILGDLIGRGDAKGIQAIDFTASGPIREPQVQVKPLSVIAPGVLRDVLRKIRP
jgi:hypothetical protein